MLTSFRKLVFWAALPHEIFHYLAARLLGLETYLDAGITWVRKGPRWKSLLAALAPAFVGLVMLSFFVWGYFTKAITSEQRTAWLLWIVFALSWLTACGQDFLAVIRLLKR